MSRHHDQIKNDPRWKAARSACLERDGYTCADCHRTAEDLAHLGPAHQLQADHLVELWQAPELAFDLDNLLTRCGDCNRRKHHATLNGEASATRLLYLSDRWPSLDALLTERFAS